jgi:hypothetical protein
MMNQGNGKKPNGGNKHGPVPSNLATALEQQSFEDFKQEVESSQIDRVVHTQMLRSLCERNPRAKDDIRKLEYLVKVSLTK